jgi:uncharacterized protein (TIGR03000 family)
MYSMVLMAALTTGMDMPDRGGRGCHGCRGGCYGGCYGMGMGCWGGGGWGGCYGMGMGCWGGGGWGGCYGMGMGYGRGWGGGYGGYVMGGYSPMMSGYAYSPMMSGYAYSPMTSSWGMGSPITSAGGTSQSFYSNPNTGNQATLVVHVPQSASLSIDGQPTQQSSATRVFTSPPLEQGKTYVYRVTAEVNRNGHMVRDTKEVDIRAGQRSEVTMNFGDSNRGGEERSEPIQEDTPRRTSTPRSSPRQPPDR